MDRINKVFTLSYDDGVTQDKRLISILDKYGLKSTFNINSELLGKDGELIREGKRVSHIKVMPEEVKDVYSGHEVAVHTLTHPLLTSLPENEVIRQVECDRNNLSFLCGYEVTGMAYPCGGVNCNEEIAGIIKEKTGVTFSRTIISSYNFSLPENPYLLNPTVHHLDDEEKINALADEFISSASAEPMLFYMWGHSYEFDIDDTWERFEKFCRKISGRSDILYMTNTEALKYFGVL